MDRLKELQSLINLSKVLNQEPDSALLEEFEGLNKRQEKIKQRIKESVAKDLALIFEAPKYELDDGPLTTEQVEKIEEVAKEEIEEPITIVEELFQKKETVVDKVASSIARQVQQEATLVKPDPQMPAENAALEQKIKYLEKWVSRIAATGSGSGEVNFRWLDDVDRSSIDQNKYLTYNPTSKKFQFVDTRVSIEAFDRSTSISIGLTPALLRPNSFINSKNLTYDTSTGVFTFLTQCEVSLALSINALASASNQRLYQYAERNTGSGFQPIVNSGKTFQLINGQITQVVNAQTISRLAGEQIRYFIYSDSADKVTLITETLPNVTGNTVFVPAIRIQYAGR